MLSGVIEITRLYGVQAISIQAVTYLEIDLFALVVLVLIFFNVSHKRERQLTDQKLFLALIVANVLALITDAGMWLTNGAPGAGMRELNILVTTVYYILNVPPCALWFLYVHNRLYKDEARIKKLLIPLCIPAALVFALSVLSIFTGWFFYFDAANTYHRGPLFLLFALLCYSYLLASLGLIFIKRKRFDKNYIRPLLTFIAIPFIAGIIQTFFYGVSIAWASMAIGLLIIFIHMQHDQLYRDYLTGLFNRRQLDEYLKKNIRNNQLIAGIMIDVDSFKEINDCYGHTVGDQALRQTAEILKKSFRQNDFIARYGGDEFVIVVGICENFDIINAADRIKENLEQFNRQKIVPFKISLSMGYDIFDRSSGMTNEQFITEIDSLMYQDKKSRLMLS